MMELLEFHEVSVRGHRMGIPPNFMPWRAHINFLPFFSTILILFNDIFSFFDKRCVAQPIVGQ